MIKKTLIFGFLCFISLPLYAASFKFDPSSVSSFSISSVVQNERDMGTLGNQVQEVESQIDVSVKRHKKGWEFFYKPQTVVMKQDGRVAGNPLMEQLQKLVYSYVIDDEGELLEVKGFDKVNELLQTVPTQYRAQLATMLNESVLVQKQKVEWTSRVTDFVGKEYNFKEPWTKSLPVTLPNGVSMQYELKTSFSKHGSSKSDKIQIKQSFAGSSSNMDKAFSSSSDVSAKKGSRFEGSLVRVVNPNTMQLFSEEGTRTMVMTVAVPGLGDRETKMIERRSLTFNY